ncbi:MAG: acyl--CoA ligase [Lachnospiraceae bacterium]|nr:acyl--CoA ligase [Lachnospiraceae bacterium]
MFESIIEAVLHYANTQPDKLCLADDTSKVSYKEYAEKIRKYATCFENAGLVRGDKIVVEACQTIDYLAIELAMQAIGMVFVPVEHNCASEKIQSFIDRAEAKAVIVTKAFDYAVEHNYTYDKFNEMYANAEAYNITELPKKEDISEILFSTGTTGKEKGIVLTHKNDIALAENVMYGVEMEKDTVEMIPSPLNHSHGLRRYYANMYNGSTVILLGSVMNIKKFFSNMDEYGVNAMDLVPTAMSVVLKLTKNRLAEYADKIQYIQLGAAPLLEDDKNKICELLPNTRLYNFYGSTESGCTCIYNFNCADSKTRCIGKPTHNTTVIIVDDDRNEIKSSETNTGLLATKGDMNMSYYWQDEEETSKVLIDGIVYSNDIAYIDDNGEVILMGRKGDVINVGGNKVSPDEIENVAKKMDVVADCGCIPIPDKSKGSVPKLFVEMENGKEFDPVEIRKFLASQLEPYKIPTVIVEIDKIPRSFNGKILRKDLQNL